MLRLALAIYDKDNVQHRPAFWNLRMAKRFEKGEDHFMAFNLPYSADLDYPEIAYDNEVIARLGLQEVWIGRIRKIEQRKQPLDYMVIRCFGNWVHLDDFSYGGKGKLWVDTRYGEWKPTTGDEWSTRYTEERYQHDTRDRLFLAPRKGERFSSSKDGGLYYECSYDQIERVTFDYSVTFQSNWRLRLLSWDSGFASGVQEWVVSATGSGSADVTLASAKDIVEFELEYNTSEAEYTGETGEGVLAKITNLKVFGSTDTTVTMDDVAKDVVDQLQAGTPIENDYTLIEAISRTLEPLCFDDGEMCLQALEKCAAFGDANNRLVGYGVEGGGYRVYVRKPDWENVRYVVHPADALRISQQGSLVAGRKGYLSEAWGQYIDEDGRIQYTDKHYVHVTSSGLVVNTTSTGDDLASDKWGQRSGVVDLGRMSSSVAVEALKSTLKERGHPIVLSGFQIIHKVKDLDRGGAEIHPLEMEMGHVVQIPYFRAVEAEGASGVDLREWDTTFLLKGLEWNEEMGTATLFPEGPEEDTRRLLAYVREMKQEA